MDKHLHKQQRIQENEYEFPYHYVPRWDGSAFSTTRHWSWGHRYLGGLQVVMAKGWKLQLDRRQGKRWLFHLDTDPTEQTNVIARHPEIAADLEARLAAYNAEVGPRAYPVAFENVTFIDRTLADPRVPGEEFSYWPN